jgi:hypothetical protein
MRGFAFLLASAAVAGASLLGAAAALADAASPFSAKAKEELVTLKTRPGVTVQFLLTQPPAEPPAAAVILFSGGDGLLRLASYSAAWRHGNFLIKNRALFAAEGLLVASPDTPSDHPSTYGKAFRASDEHAADIAAIIAYLHRDFRGPVWLIGTSLGTLSAVDGALLPPERGADGVVLTSSITRSFGGSMTVFNFPLGAVRIPTLIVAHREDACKASPANEAPNIAAKLEHAPKVEVRIFEGGTAATGDPCEPLHRHGYIGIEHDVVAAIADWIKAAPPRH